MSDVNALLQKYRDNLEFMPGIYEKLCKRYGVVGEARLLPGGGTLDFSEPFGFCFELIILPHARV